jgi:hypothetical protein
MTRSVAVYLEVGAKRTFAAALEWPGWARAAKDESDALSTFLAYGPRYARVVQRAGLELAVPTTVDDLDLVARLEGDSSTDFGVPERQAPGDAAPIGGDELGRFRAILEACWSAFDAAVDAAAGEELTKGPRGGGRGLAQIVGHVLEAEAGYLRLLPWPAPPSTDADWAARAAIERSAVLEAVEATAPVGQPEPGPRGGRRWPARYFVRRAAWHVLDHAWEIEDRTPR